MKYLGALAPIVTPCSKDGEIDETGLRNVAEYMHENGCNSLMVCGSTGRGPWYSIKKNETICRVVRDFMDDMTIFAGCMGGGIDEIVINTKAMADSGADIAVITVPFYFKYNSVEMENILLRCADKSPIPVLIYDIPDFTKTKLDTEMLIQLASHGNIVGLKDSSFDIHRFSHLADVLKKYKDFYLLQGKEPLLTESALMGASGLVVSFLHIHPRPFTKLLEKIRYGDIKGAVRIQEKITEVYNIFEDCTTKRLRPETSTLFLILEYCLRKRQVCENITLQHEGQAPDWLKDKAEKMSSILEETLEP